MEKEIEWLDLYIKDFGDSQIKDTKELISKRKKMKTFYIEFLLPLYKPVQNSKKFNFSVPDEELTCRIMFEDLKKYHKIESVRELLYKVAEHRPAFTEEKIEKLIEYMRMQKEAKETETEPKR